MASIANPVLAMQNSNYANLMPGRNPTGSTTSGGNSLPAIGSSSGTNPALPPTNIPSGAPATNQYDPTSVIPTFGANTGGYTSTSLVPPGSSSGGGVGSFGNMSKSQIASMQRDLNRTYGSGMGQAIMDFLMGGAGFNQDAVNNLIASLQPGFNRDQQTLLQQFGTSGNRFGSGAQIGMADLMSQEQLNVGQIEAQMYQQSVQNFIDVLMGTTGQNAQRKMSSPSFMDTLTGILGIGGNAAQGASSAISASNPGADTTLLDIIGSLCWVASELYGGWFAPETIKIRGWLLRTWYMAPFVWFYRKCGVRWASLIRRNRTARFFTKKLFDVFLEAAQ